MRKQNIKKVIATMLLSLIIITLTEPLQALAATDPDVQAVADQYAPGGSKGNTVWPSEFSSYFVSSDPGTYDKVTVAGRNYFYNPSNKDAILKSAKSAGGNEAISNVTNELDIYTTDGDYQIKADVAGAAGLMSGFQGTLNTFLGVLVTLITVGMTIFTALDLSYIAFPALRGKVDEKKEEGKFKHIVTEDARYAVVKADVENTGQNAFVIYGKKRVLSFIVLSILIFILLTGNINVLTNIGVHLAEGILKALNAGF